MVSMGSVLSDVWRRSRVDRKTLQFSKVKLNEFCNIQFIYCDNLFLLLDSNGIKDFLNKFSVQNMEGSTV